MKSFYQSDLIKLFLFNILLAMLISIGSIDRSFAFLFLAMSAAFFITKPFKESLQLFLMSLPLYIALPLAGGFDSMSVWRPLSLLLLIVWLWKRKLILWEQPLAFWEELWQRKSLLYLVIAWLLFIFIATVSLVWAQDKGEGVKAIIYFCNILAVLFIFAWESKGPKDVRILLHRASIANALTLLVGFLQFSLTLGISLLAFWQWWAAHPIAAYYGEKTSHLLSYSNTWFSYYGSELPATLRMFSVFQDSHAFAMFALLGITLWGAWFLWFEHRQDQKGSLLSLGLIAVNALAVILSGSRGAWMGALILTGGIALIMALRLNLPGLPAQLLKKGFGVLIIFFLLFPVSTLMLASAQQAQLFLEGKAGAFDLSLAFWRARSAFDIKELSNKGRLEIWRDSYAFLVERKFLTGTGIGNFSTVLELRPEKSRAGASAHSLYLQFLTELGIAGLLSIGTILFLILYRAYAVIKESSTDVFIRGYAFAFLFGFVWILIYSLVDVTLLNDKVFLLTAILIGMLYGIQKPKTLPDEQH